MEKKQLQHDFMHLTRRCGRLFKRNINLRIDRTGIYQSQHMILMFLSVHPSVTQKELAEKMEISSAAVAVTLKKLRNGGYIQSESDSEDGRCNRISLSSKGKKAIDYGWQQFEYVENNLFADFTKEELETMINLLGRMESRLIQMEEIQRKKNEEECE